MHAAGNIAARAAYFLITILSALSLPAPALAAIILLLGVFALQRSGKREAAVPVILGFFIPWSAFLAPETPLVGAALSLVFLAPAARQAGIAWLIPYLVIGAAWLLGDLLFTADPAAVLAVLQGAHGPGPKGIYAVWEWIASASPSSLHRRILALLNLYLLAVFFGILQQSDQRGRFMRGLFLGLFPAALLSLLQLSALVPQLFPNQSHFWNTIGRNAGSFSDPNAFGLFSLLALAIIPMAGCFKGNSHQRWYVFLLLLFWSAMGICSGSRSFLLGSFLFLIFLLLRYRRRLLLVLGIFVLGVVLCVNLLPEPVTETLSARLPTGLERLRRTIDINTVESALYSRIVFSRINIALWRDAPVFGVGFHKFRDWVPVYAAKLGTDSGLWSDNSNNFYLGVLAQLGLVGAAALIFGLARFRKISCLGIDGVGRIGIAQAMTYAFALLLLTGPHINFTEVSLPLAAIMAGGFTLNTSKRRDYFLLFLLFVAASLIMARSYYSEYGFYQWESNEHGYLRWSAGRAQSYLDCDAEGRAKLSLRVLHPDLAVKPVELVVHSSSGEVISRMISAPQDVHFELACRQIPHMPKPLFEERVLRYQISVSRVWMPRRYGQGEDARLLGVQVLTPDLAGHGNWLPGRM